MARLTYEQWKAHEAVRARKAHEDAARSARKVEDWIWRDPDWSRLRTPHDTLHRRAQRQLRRGSLSWRSRAL